MLASIFGKVTASLGRTYVFAGLLPAGALLLYLLLYYAPPGALIGAAEALFRDEAGWKALAWAGAAWIALGFLFYAARALVLGAFQYVPTGRIGRALLFRRTARRERAKRAQIELEWRQTALYWARALGFDRARIGAPPHWILRPDPDAALARAASGRGALIDADRRAGDALALRPGDSAAIEDGLFALYLLARRSTTGPLDAAVERELASWRSAAGSAQAGAVLDVVEQDLGRRFAKAFAAAGRFGDGAYVFPTRLGNRISALDDYSERRYGIDTATLWDRLWWVLPADAKAEVSEARLAVESLLNLAAALLLGAGLLLCLEAVNCRLRFGLAGPACNAVPALGFLAAGLAAAFVAYRGAAFAMDMLASKMTTLIDAYRLKLIQQLGFQVANVGEEAALLAELRGFFVQAGRRDPARPLAPAKPPAAPQPGDAPLDRSGGEGGG